MEKEIKKLNNDQLLETIDSLNATHIDPNSQLGILVNAFLENSPRVTAVEAVLHMAPKLAKELAFRVKTGVFS